MKETVQVTREDREAAAALVPLCFGASALWQKNVLAGYYDDGEIVQAFARHRLSATSAPTGVEGLEAEVQKWRHKLWMVACHAMGGGMPDIEGIEQSTNDICVQISALRNKVYQAGKDAALAAAPAPSGQDVAGEPIPMILHCPRCHTQHIDEPDERTPEWDNPPHRSHLCHVCHFIWRPADVPTEGVAAIKTRGKADTATTPPASGVTVPEGEVERAAGQVQSSVGMWDKLNERTDPKDAWAAYGEQLRHDAMRLVAAVAALSTPSATPGEEA